MHSVAGKITSIHSVYFWETSWHFQVPVCADRITSLEALKHITATRRHQVHTLVAARPASPGSLLSPSRPWASYSFCRPPLLHVPPMCKNRVENVNTSVNVNRFYARYALYREGCAFAVASGRLLRHLETGVLSVSLFFFLRNKSNFFAKSCTAG